MEFRHTLYRTVIAGAALATLWGCGASRHAQIRVTPENLSLQPDSAGRVEVAATLDIPARYFGRRSRLFITPQFVQGGRVVRELAPAVLDAPIYGKKMQRLAVLEGYRDTYGESARRVKPGQPYTYPYRAALYVPGEARQGRLQLVLSKDGCGSCTGMGTVPVAAFSDPYTLFDRTQPMRLRRMEPEYRVVPKVRQGEGSALISFTINRAEIDLARGDNRRELEGMLNTLAPIVRDTLATVDRISIAGLASADGSLAFNTALALRRASAARDWLVGKLGLTPQESRRFAVTSRPEGWEPVWAAMQAAGSPGAEAVRGILDRYADKGDDVQEYHIRRTPYWNEIKAHYLQKDRKVEYAYTYTIRSFTTDDEMLRLYKVRPDTFNEQELLRVATLVGESERAGVYRIVVYYFPQSAAGNNNLALLLMDEGRDSDAALLLEKAGATTPELCNTQGVLCASQGDEERAAGLFGSADLPEARYNLGLLRARQHRCEEAYELLEPFGGVNAALMALCTGRDREAWQIMERSDDRTPLAEYCRALAAARLGDEAAYNEHIEAACRDAALRARAEDEADFLRYRRNVEPSNGEKR